MLGLSVNRSPVDPFTALHFGTGYLLGLKGVPAAITLGLGLYWDLDLERRLRCQFPDAFAFAEQDSKSHIFYDTLFYMLGWAYGRRARQNAPPPIV